MILSPHYAPFTNILLIDLLDFTADAVLKNMNPSVDPCDDFYEFACGRFLKETQIPEDKTSITTFSNIGDMLMDQLKLIVTDPVAETDIKPYKLAKYMYKACMDRSEYRLPLWHRCSAASLPK